MAAIKDPLKEVEHTPFCNRYCQMNHHDLIGALFAIHNFPDGYSKPGSLHLFSEVVQGAIVSGWNKNSNIPDQLEDLQCPIIYLACAFGRHKALQLLLKMDFDAAVRLTETEETGLHAAVRHLYQAGAWSENKSNKAAKVRPKARTTSFTKILNLLTEKCPEIFGMKDTNWQTAFHAVADELVDIRISEHDISRGDTSSNRTIQSVANRKHHFEQCFRAMLVKFTELEEQGQVSTEEAFYILCSRNKVRRNILEMLSENAAEGDPSLEILKFVIGKLQSKLFAQEDESRSIVEEGSRVKALSSSSAAQCLPAAGVSSQPLIQNHIGQPVMLVPMTPKASQLGPGTVHKTSFTNFVENSTVHVVFGKKVHAGTSIGTERLDIGQNYCPSSGTQGVGSVALTTTGPTHQARKPCYVAGHVSQRKRKSDHHMKDKEKAWRTFAKSCRKTTIATVRCDTGTVSASNDTCTNNNIASSSEERGLPAPAEVRLNLSTQVKNVDNQICEDVVMHYEKLNSVGEDCYSGSQGTCSKSAIDEVPAEDGATMDLKRNLSEAYYAAFALEKECFNLETERLGCLASIKDKEEQMKKLRLEMNELEQKATVIADTKVKVQQHWREAQELEKHFRQKLFDLKPDSIEII